MQYIRIDGPSTAPMCFLTIEDGGDFWMNEEPHTQERFNTIISQSGEWHPSATELRKKLSERGKLGKPGVVIPKIVVGMRDGSLARAADYRSRLLYRCNESNLKYYPLGRPNQKTWYPEFSEYLGISEYDYLDLCKTVRPSIIADRYKSISDSGGLFIILGAKVEWISTLAKLNEQADDKIDFYASESTPVKSDAKRTSYELYFSKNGRLIFAYYGMFVHGQTDENVLRFAKRIRELRPDVVASLRECQDAT